MLISLPHVTQMKLLFCFVFTVESIHLSIETHLCNMLSTYANVSSLLRQSVSLKKLRVVYLIVNLICSVPLFFLFLRFVKLICFHIYYECMILPIICVECMLLPVICVECMILPVICVECMIVPVICVECMILPVICVECMILPVICVEYITITVFT